MQWQILFPNLKAFPQLWLRGSLSNGQCFSWSLLESVAGDDNDDEEVWQGVIQNQVVKLKQKQFLQNDSLSPVYFSSRLSKEVLEAYFRADIDLPVLYNEWSSKCSRFAMLSPHVPGIRLLRQEKLECILSFITSSNNHIKRIHSLLDKFRIRFGVKIQDDDDPVYAFPTVESLEQNPDFTVSTLREMGFGYRAKYIKSTCDLLVDSVFWNALTEAQSSKELTEKLCMLSGVGRKVADCISLFSFDRLEVVPVDVHVCRIAQRDYNANGALDGITTVNKVSYDLVTREFHERFGPNAGWAHSVLFTCELDWFRTRLPPSLEMEMTAFKKTKKKAAPHAKRTKKE